MQKLSLSKQLSIVRLYLSGFSYDEIATRSGVSKGTVANVVADLKAGRIIDVHEPVEQLELLRELAIDLRRLKLTLGQAVTGTAIVSRLQELSVEPGDIERWATMCRHLAGEEAEAQAFVRAALNLEEVRERTGLSAEALEEKVHGLEQKVARLEPLAQELKGRQQQLEEQEKRRQALANEISELEKRHEPLSRDVIQKERREAELSHNLQELEERAQAADERLAVSRNALKVLAGLGLSPDDLLGFVQRVGGVAQRHGIEPAALRDRLLHDLEQLEVGLGLESFGEVKRHELDGIEQAVARSQKERAALDSALQQIRQQQASLHTAIAEERDHVLANMQGIAKIAKDAVAELRQDLKSGVGEALLEVQKLRSEAIELGEELGRYNATVEANQWLQTLVALVKGDGDIGASEVQVIGLLVLRGVQSWLEQNKSGVQLPFLLRTQVGKAIEEMIQWKV